MSSAIIRGISLSVVLFAGFTVSAAEYTRESIDAIDENLSTRRAILLDVREEAETNKGYIDGAFLVPISLLDEGKEYPEFAQVLRQRLPQNAIIYTYCSSGKSCRTAADILAGFGYQARPLKHTYADLVQEGFVTAKPK